MLHAGVIALSSFLLFLVQPLIARLILPWFGGGAAVWTTCMLFFQSLLLAGYAYAHASIARLAPRRQALVHVALLVAATATLPILPDAAWKPLGTTEPVSAILVLLAATVGLPYLMLSATSPLAQAWFARMRPGGNPYRLFALSNFASLAALIGYPLFVEPYLSSGEQVQAWSWLFALFALLCAVLAWRGGAPSRQAPAAAEPASAPDRARQMHWLALSTTGSVMLLAVTNHITQNIAAVPLLWVAPLTLYLVSFIVAFEGRLYRPERFWIFALIGLGAMAWLLADSRLQFELKLQLGVFLAGLFVVCLFCHGELYRLRPATPHLTLFYLIVAGGGALGGFLVAVLAPIAFDGYHELGLGLVAAALLVAVCCRRLAQRPARALSLLVLTGVSGSAAYDGLRFQEHVVHAARSFYGVLRIKEYGRPGDPDHLRRLLHGVILHGEQYLHPGQRAAPTTYYRTSSGIGAALLARAARAEPMRVGVIGLGVGTLAAYGRPGDVFRFYEINPRVVESARRDFTYLADSDARIELSLGDARLALEREPPQDFDVLAVDAFSGDAIPVHLITREALALYLSHVAPAGIVAFHVSNRFLDLVPPVAQMARERGVHARVVHEDADDAGARTQSDWVLVSRAEASLEARALQIAGAEEIAAPEGVRAWTDDYSNLVQVLK